jgi:hypothetical protein
VRRCLPLLLAAALAGCGYDRTAPVDTDTPADPRGERAVRLTEAGVRFKAPGNWPDLPLEEPRVGGVHSGLATVAVWRYVRSEELPRSRAELDRARELLLDRVRERDPTFETRRVRILRRRGAPGIEVRGRQTLAGRPAETRSLHLFARGSEYVVDAYAPPEHFGRVDVAVFRPLLRSVRVGRR